VTVDGRPGRDGPADEWGHSDSRWQWWDSRGRDPGRQWRRGGRSIGNAGQHGTHADGDRGRDGNLAGTLRGGVITLTGEGRFLVGISGNLDGVTLNGKLDLTRGL